MAKYYTADYILPINTAPLKNGVIAVADDGEILNVYPKASSEIGNKRIEKLEGILVPGFINSHCHLELSHMHGKIEPHLGLIPFIKQIISNREATNSTIEEAMLEADRKMLKNGIVAVGDISNKSISKSVKETSAIYYHTFIETLSFDPDKAKDEFKNALDLREEFGEQPTSIVPHAPYSVSKNLFRYISRFCDDDKNPITIHNQESEEENKFYRYKTGGFVDFYKSLNLDISYFKPQARNSVQTIMPLLPAKQRIMLVHNTYTSLKDIYFIRRFGRNITWCFCPKANLYIEDKLPKIEMFLFNDFNTTIGTDSLASNDELCILSELKVLHKHFPALDLTKTLAWATINGAKFLGIDNLYGSLEKGKKPGLNLISNVNDLKLTEHSIVTRII